MDGSTRSRMICCFNFYQNFLSIWLDCGTKINRKEPLAKFGKNRFNKDRHQLIIIQWQKQEQIKSAAGVILKQLWAVCILYHHFNRFFKLQIITQRFLPHIITILPERGFLISSVLRALAGRIWRQAVSLYPYSRGSIPILKSRHVWNYFFHYQCPI